MERGKMMDKNRKHMGKEKIENEINFLDSMIIDSHDEETFNE
jgi:hypothetical protein